MPDTLTLAAFNALSPAEQDHILRQEITRVLELKPGPWKHEVQQFVCQHIVDGQPVPIEPRHCKRCHVELAATDLTSEDYYWEPGHLGSRIVAKEATCIVPPEASGSWADLAEKLKDYLEATESQHHLGGGFILLGCAIHDFAHTDDTDEEFSWWYLATARERVICLLIALGRITA